MSGRRVHTLCVCTLEHSSWRGPITSARFALFPCGWRLECAHIISKRAPGSALARNPIAPSLLRCSRRAGCWGRIARCLRIDASRVARLRLPLASLLGGGWAAPRLRLGCASARAPSALARHPGSTRSWRPGARPIGRGVSGFARCLSGSASASVRRCVCADSRTTTDTDCRGPAISLPPVRSDSRRSIRNTLGPRNSTGSLTLSPCTPLADYPLGWGGSPARVGNAWRR